MWFIAADIVVVCWSVCHDCEPCKNDLTDRSDFGGVDLGENKEPCIRWGSDLPYMKAHFWGGKVWPILKV